MYALIDTVGFQEISLEEMMLIDGGAWCWGGFRRSTLDGAVGGSVAGAFAGTIKLPVIGTVAGWVGGGIIGGISGAAAYAVTGWW